MFWDAGAAPGIIRDRAMAAAERLHVKPQAIPVRSPADIEQACRTAPDGRAQAIHVLPSPFFSAHRRTLIAQAARHRLPGMYEFKGYVEDGGLCSYGPSIAEMYRRSASYVDRILKGAKPGDLPMERPTKFELAVNLRTARTLDLAIPRPVLLRADAVIE